MRTRFQLIAAARSGTDRGGTVRALPRRQGDFDGRKARGFTLIELMIVISLIAIFMATGVPAMVRGFERDDLARAVRDTIEGCKTARDRAILQGVPHSFVLKENGEMLVEAMPMENRITTRERSGEPRGVSAGPYSGFPRQLGADVMIQLVDVNFVSHMDSAEARARFFPNGTADEFTVVYAWNGKQRSVTVDIVTGHAVELIRQ